MPQKSEHRFTSAHWQLNYTEDSRHDPQNNDLPAVEYVCNEIAVMYLGGIVERAKTGELFGRTNHPYTEALVASIPEQALDHAFERQKRSLSRARSLVR